MGNNGKYIIGDIVTLNTHPLYQGKGNDISIRETEKEVSLLGKKIVASPRTITLAMVIIEKVREMEKKLHDTNTGKQINSSWKYKCQYYVWKEGIFKETWFDEDIIVKISLKTTQVSYDFGGRTVFKTYSYDIAYAKYLQNFKPDGKTPSIIPDLIIPKYAPPYMIMIGYEKAKVDTPIYRTNREGKEEQIRYLSDYKIKCKWYNPIDCKFSEDWFIPEALISIEEK
jgi:hypothetical protein